MSKQNADLKAAFEVDHQKQVNRYDDSKKEPWKKTLYEAIPNAFDPNHETFVGEDFLQKKVPLHELLTKIKAVEHSFPIIEKMYTQIQSHEMRLVQIEGDMRSCIKEIDIKNRMNIVKTTLETFMEDRRSEIEGKVRDLLQSKVDSDIFQEKLDEAVRQIDFDKVEQRLCHNEGLTVRIHDNIIDGYKKEAGMKLDNKMDKEQCYDMLNAKTDLDLYHIHDRTIKELEEKLNTQMAEFEQMKQMGVFDNMRSSMFSSGQLVDDGSEGVMRKSGSRMNSNTQLEHKVAQMAKMRRKKTKRGQEEPMDMEMLDLDIEKLNEEEVIEYSKRRPPHNIVKAIFNKVIERINEQEGLKQDQLNFEKSVKHQMEDLRRKLNAANPKTEIQNALGKITDVLRKSNKLALQLEEMKRNAEEKMVVIDKMEHTINKVKKEWKEGIDILNQDKDRIAKKVIGLEQRMNGNEQCIEAVKLEKQQILDQMVKDVYELQDIRHRHDRALEKLIIKTSETIPEEYRAMFETVDTKLEAIRGPLVAEIKNIKSENQIIMREFGRTMNVNRDLVGDYIKFIDAQNPKSQLKQIIKKSQNQSTMSGNYHTSTDEANENQDLSIFMTQLEGNRENLISKAARTVNTADKAVRRRTIKSKRGFSQFQTHKNSIHPQFDLESAGSPNATRNHGLSISPWNDPSIMEESKTRDSSRRNNSRGNTIGEIGYFGKGANRGRKCKSQMSKYRTGKTPKSVQSKRRPQTKGRFNEITLTDNTPQQRWDTAQYSKPQLTITNARYTTNQQPSDQLSEVELANSKEVINRDINVSTQDSIDGPIKIGQVNIIDDSIFGNEGERQSAKSGTIQPAKKVFRIPNLLQKPEDDFEQDKRVQMKKQKEAQKKREEVKMFNHEDLLQKMKIGFKSESSKQADVRQSLNEVMVTPKNVPQMKKFIRKRQK